MRSTVAKFFMWIVCDIMIAVEVIAMNQLWNRLRRLNIQPFYHYIVYTMAGIYLLQMFLFTVPLTNLLSFNRALILRGQIWRLFTFIVVPPMSSPLSALLFLYLYYMLGTGVERRLGARRFFWFYLAQVVLAIFGGLVVGSTVNDYINLSVMLVFAILYPDAQLMLFFVLPVKMKWLAVFELLLLLRNLLLFPLSHKVAIIMSLVGIALFFGGDAMNQLRLHLGQWKRRRDWKKNFQ